MKISILHPSRHRPKQMLDTAETWLSQADNRSVIEYIFSLDTDDDTIPDWVVGLKLPNKSAIEAINNAAKICTGDLIIVVSDDFNEPPHHWDTLLKAELEDKSDFVLKTVDGLQPTLVTLPILDRVWYEKYGYVYHPDYSHLYADQELTAVAAMTGKLLFSDLYFPHNHYTTGKVRFDAINAKNNATDEQGKQLFAQRQAFNFGITDPIMSYEHIVWQHA